MTDISDTNWKRALGLIEQDRACSFTGCRRGPTRNRGNVSRVQNIHIARSKKAGRKAVSLPKVSILLLPD